MDAEIKDDWVKALRSGDYKQGKGALRHKMGYCCLGVLCDVVGEGRWEESDTSRRVFVYEDNRSELMIAHAMMDDLKLDPDYAEELADMNDDGATFSEIADWIEEYL